MVPVNTSDDQIRAAYDQAVAEWAAARAAIEADGITLTDPKGKPIPHPAIAVERSASAEMRRWLPDIRRMEADTAPPAAGRPKRSSPGW